MKLISHNLHNHIGNIVITPPGEKECMRQNVKKPDRKSAKNLKKEIEVKNFHDPTKSEIKDFIKEINRKILYEIFYRIIPIVSIC